ncbi:MAG TPA: type II toxin-antitoxin system prevent-host-death family antitoxin [Geminicoccaceae bacterium]|nr:type II toxin-antitoxin system prevent-host-death family antitoxin [Geminicoccaceae bacterium]
MADRAGELVDQLTPDQTSSQDLSHLSDQVEGGETITITRHGKPVARLIPVGGSSRDERRRAIEQLKALRAGRTLGGLSLRELIDEGRR